MNFELRTTDRFNSNNEAGKFEFGLFSIFRNWTPLIV